MLRKFMNRKARKGFSLIELLIVIAIIGIIATIAIPLLLSARNNALNEKARNSLRSFASAEVAYYAQQGTYGSAADLAGATPPYCDGRFVAGDLGNNITFAVDSSSSTAFQAHAVGATTTYTVTESGQITEAPNA